MKQMRETTEATIEERQARIADAKREAQAVLDALDCAESCETPGDFDANLREAIAHAGALRAEIAEIGEER